jgi:hypothetical protein
MRRYLTQTGVTDLKPLKALTQVHIWIDDRPGLVAPAELRQRVHIGK